MWRLLPSLLFVLFAGILPLGLGPTVAAGQVPTVVAPSDTVWEIRLTDGTTIVGQVIAGTADRFTVRTATGVTVELDRAVVQRMLPARGTIREGVLWPEDPNQTRLFFGPTGRMLERNEGYFGVFELFLPFLSYGVIDNLTLAGGTPVIPEVIGRIWYFAPKVGVQLAEGTHIAGGVLAFFDMTSGGEDPVGIFYAVGTRGNEDYSGTLGVGWGFAGEETSNRPTFMAGAEIRSGRRTKIITENHLILHGNSLGETEGIGIFSAGIRFFGERLSADGGLALYIGDSETFCCVPLVNFVYNFGGGR